MTIVAVALATLLGVPLGILSALRRNQLPDHLARVVALFFVSFPAFWLAMIFQSFFGLDLKWFPTGKRFDVRIAPPESITGMILFDSLLHLDFKAFSTGLRYIVLPALVLSFGSLASITRNEYGQPLSVEVPGEGRREFEYTEDHILRNALNSIITMISLEFGWLMAGAVLVETIFDWPGLGLYAVESSLRLDFQPIMGITILYGIVFSLLNIATDVIYGFVDPRIRYG